MTYTDRKGYESLREKMNERGFYVCGTEPLEFAPMPNGFTSKGNANKFLGLQMNDYHFVAFKNFSLQVGLHEEVVKAFMMVMLGSFTKEPHPLIEITTFYKGRMYKHAHYVTHFYRALQYENWDSAIEKIFCGMDDTIDSWYRIVRTLIMEGRWPEQEFVSDVKFLEL